MGQVETGKATGTGSRSRVARHRTKAMAEGSRRIEVTVPDEDAKLVKAIAAALRAGGDQAEHVRDALKPFFSSPRAKTGRELVEFLRSAPVVGSELEVDRDSSKGRSAAFD